MVTKNIKTYVTAAASVSCSSPIVSTLRSSEKKQGIWVIYWCAAPFQFSDTYTLPSSYLCDNSFKIKELILQAWQSSRTDIKASLTSMQWIHSSRLEGHPWQPCTDFKHGSRLPITWALQPIKNVTVNILHEQKPLTSGSCVFLTGYIVSR